MCAADAASALPRSHRVVQPWSFAAVSAMARTWYRAPASSFSFGCRCASGPAIVVALSRLSTISQMVNSVVSWPPAAPPTTRRRRLPCPEGLPSPIGRQPGRGNLPFGTTSCRSACPCLRRWRRTQRGLRCARLRRSGRACIWLPWRPPEIEVQARASRRRTSLPHARPRRISCASFSTCPKEE